MGSMQTRCRQGVHVKYIHTETPNNSNSTTMSPPSKLFIVEKRSSLSFVDSPVALDDSLDFLEKTRLATKPCSTSIRLIEVAVRTSVGG